MKVKELIEILSKFDQDLDVVTFSEGSLEYIDYQEWNHEIILYKKNGEYWDSLNENNLGATEVKVIAI